MPVVLQIEALAQAGCIYFYHSRNLQGKNLIYYLGKVTARFMAPVIPGDQIKMEIQTVKFLGNTGILKGQAFVQDKQVAEAEIVFSAKET